MHARVKWEAADRPLIQETQNGLAGVHPLLKAVESCEALAARLRSELGLSPKSAKAVVQRRVGRPVGAVSAADRVPPPVRLRSVDHEAKATG